MRKINELLDCLVYEDHAVVHVDSKPEGTVNIIIVPYSFSALVQLQLVEGNKHQLIREVHCEYNVLVHCVETLSKLGKYHLNALATIEKHYKLTTIKEDSTGFVDSSELAKAKKYAETEVNKSRNTHDIIKELHGEFRTGKRFANILVSGAEEVSKVSIQLGRGSYK